MRAQHLGSTAVTIRVRCSCGQKADFYKYFWQRRGYVICDRCKSFILYHSLEVKASSWQGYAEINSQLVAGELGAFQQIEAELRAFLQRYDAQPQWLWSPQTSQLVSGIRPQLERLEELRQQGPEPERVLLTQHRKREQ
ncbi:MAG: hypothetical protein QOF02_3660 [Blastocatellia bacterium]|jgi:hypothetical protein|nr:hypothetical protein [Blastocatellia bacterium]